MTPTVFSDFIAAAGWNASMLILLAKATLILLTALGITMAMQRASAGARHLVWLVTVGALLLVPALSAWAPLRLRVLPVAGASAITMSDKVSAAPKSGSENRIGGVDGPVTGMTAGSELTPAETPIGSSFVDRVSALSGVSILLAIWGTVVLLIAASLAYGTLVVRRIVRGSLPLDTQDWLTPLWEVSDRLELEEPPRLLRSDDAKMPFACGLLRPTIVLPAECDNWTLDRRRAVLLHELAHVRRHDLVGHTLGRIACAFYWFHPLVWTAAKHLRAESERACDDLALACGARPSDYAEHLLDIVTSVRHDSTPVVALAMARRKEFEGRMLAILDPELRHSGPGRLQAAGLIASLAVISIAVGAAAPAHRIVEQAQFAAGHAQNPGIDAKPVVESAEKSTDREETVTRMEVTSSTVAGVSMKSDSQFIQSAATAEANPRPIDLEAIAAAERPKAVAAPQTVAALTGPLQRVAESSAARASQARGDDRPVLLANVLRTDTSASLRRVAAWGLAEYADTQVGAGALASALRRDSNAAVREMAAWALSNGDDGNSTVVEALTAALRSDANPRVRGIAAWALGSVGDRDAVGALAAALGDADASVRRRAAWALGHVEPREAPRPLVDMLRDRDSQTREIAAWALFQIRDRNTVTALDAALRAEQDKGLQMAYIKALAAIGEHSVDAIRRLLDSPDPRIKSMAVRALAGGSATGPWPWPWPEPRPFP